MSKLDPSDPSGGIDNFAFSVLFPELGLIMRNNETLLVAAACAKLLPEMGS